MQWFWLIPSVGFGLVLGFTTGQWLSAAMAAVTAVGFIAYSVFSGKRAVVQANAPVHLGLGRVAIGNRVLPKSSWRWKGDWIEAVDHAVRQEHQDWLAAQRLTAKVTGSLAAQQPAPSGLGLWAGFDGQTQIDFDLANDGPHLLIVGATGSGKSQFLTLGIKSLVTSYQPQQLAFVFIDFKGGSALQQFSQLPHSLGILTNHHQHATAFFADLLQHMQKRELQLAAQGLSRIEDMPQLQRPPRILVCIDELQPVLQLPQALPALDSIAARGRSLGIHLMVTTQSLAGFPRTLLTNLTLRVGIGRLDPIDAAQLGLGKASTQASPQSADNWQHAVFCSANSSGNFRFPSGGLVQ